MLVGILLITLSIINVLLLILTICLVFSQFYYYSIAIIFIVIVLYLSISIIFFKHTNKYLKNEENVLRLFKLSRCVRKENEIKVIEFAIDHNKFVNKKDETIKFSLDNYLFKKSFIIARIIREVRYPVVSNQLNLLKLFAYKLKLNNIDNLVVRFIKRNKIKEYVIVKNHISKNTILSRAISKSKYFDCYLSNRSYNEYLKRVRKIDENIYLNS